ncbi:MAG: O-methyltransferase [Anaerolineae bacterium]|nr:O-methyltransferase [Anaerolineae bacterium]
MFHQISLAMSNRMHELEEKDAIDRQDGTPRLQRLRQIPPETGKFLALLAASAPSGEIVEIGTSAGYSTMWLSLARRHITTFEILPEKAALARETFKAAGIEEQVTLIEGDARDHLNSIHNAAFSFLDAEKDAYEACYNLIIPRIKPGGILAADNAINHAPTLQPWMDCVLEDRRVDALIVPIGKGVFVCRKI